MSNIQNLIISNKNLRHFFQPAAKYVEAQSVEPRTLRKPSFSVGVIFKREQRLSAGQCGSKKLLLEPTSKLIF